MCIRESSLARSGVRSSEKYVVRETVSRNSMTERGTQNTDDESRACHVQLHDCICVCRIAMGSAADVGILIASEVLLSSPGMKTLSALSSMCIIVDVREVHLSIPYVPPVAIVDIDYR